MFFNVIFSGLERNCDIYFMFKDYFYFLGVMGEYESKIEVYFFFMVIVVKGIIVKMECFVFGK